jgi:nicotinamidase-related amidase
MPQAQTMMQMLGAEPQPVALSTSAVLMIDAQIEYVRGRLQLPGAAPALQAGAQLLERARSANRPVLHIQHLGKAGGFFDPETENFSLAPEVAARDGEPVINKGLPNAFSGTDLEEQFRATGATSLIVAGFMTHMCVSTTVRVALDLGIPCTVVSNACASRDLPDSNGQTIDAATIHRAGLAALSDRFCSLVATADDLPA